MPKTQWQQTIKHMLGIIRQKLEKASWLQSAPVGLRFWELQCSYGVHDFRAQGLLKIQGYLGFAWRLVASQRETYAIQESESPDRTRSI